MDAEKSAVLELIDGVVGSVAIASVTLSSVD
jgi:hypothetical protein